MKDLHSLLNIKTNNIEPARGRILISEPFLGDFYFKRSVVLLAEHGDEGSFGLIMNKPLSAQFNEVVKEFPEFESPVFLGGPVQNNNLFFIHTLGDKIAASQEILPGIYWGGDLDQIKELINLKKLRADDIRFFIGYSGWGSKQLDGELKRNAWVVSNTSADMLLNTLPRNLWEKSLKKLGGKYFIWTNFPSDPVMN